MGWRVAALVFARTFTPVKGPIAPTSGVERGFADERF
jgi:hypothetical protein